MQKEHNNMNNKEVSSPRKKRMVWNESRAWRKCKKSELWAMRAFHRLINAADLILAAVEESTEQQISKLLSIESDERRKIVDLRFEYMQEHLKAVHAFSQFYGRDKERDERGEREGKDSTSTHFYKLNYENDKNVRGLWKWSLIQWK